MFSLLNGTLELSAGGVANSRPAFADMWPKVAPGVRWNREPGATEPAFVLGPGTPGLRNAERALAELDRRLGRPPATTQPRVCVDDGR